MKKIKVTTPNRMLLIKNILVRTPVDIEIRNKSEEDYFKLYLKKECADYIILDDTIVETPNTNKSEPSVIIENKSKKVDVFETSFPTNDSDMLDLPIPKKEQRRTTPPKIEELKPTSNRILDTILTDE